MPSFEYTAIDRQGKSVQGEVQADTRDQAALNLTRTGLLVSRLAQAGVAPMQSTPSAGQIIQQQVASPTAPVQRQVPTATQTASSAPTKAADSAVPAKGGKASDKLLMLAFSQLASMLKSGLSVQTSAGHLISRVSTGPMTESLRDMQQAATEGNTMSRIMERYPGIYPPHTVGLMRTGEETGAMPEAAQKVADWASNSHVFKKKFWLLRATAISIPLLYPFLSAVVQGSLSSMKKQEANGYNLDAAGNTAHEIGLNMPVVLLWWAIGIAAYFGFRAVWQSMRFRPLRHRLVMLLPAVGARARAESLGLFAWSFGKMSAAGHYPQYAWQIASSSMPNLHMAERMLAIGNRADRNTPAATMMRDDPSLIPPEYADIVETSDVTGDIPGAMTYIGRASDGEFAAKQESSPWVIGLYAYVPFAVMVIVILATLYKTLYSGIITITLGE